MLSRQLATASRQAQLLRPRLVAQCPTVAATRNLRAASTSAEVDNDLNGGYVNPPKQKREDRDPYGEYWDKQERRNFGEPVHEDNDILGRFSPYQYKHFSSGKGLVLWSGFLACVAGLSTAVYMTYPDRPSYPKEYPGGLEAELGGPHALQARKAGDAAP